MFRSEQRVTTHNIRSCGSRDLHAANHRSWNRRKEVTFCPSGVWLRRMAMALIPLTPFILRAANPLPPCDRTIAEAGLRQKLVTYVVPPVYPQPSIRAKHTGIVVAAVCVGPNSRSATSLKILTAPDQAMANSVQQAIANWKFGALWRSGAEGPRHFVSYASKITYYFVEQGGRWLVHSPMDSFFVGPRFALDQQGSHPFNK
jgi:hypothetical protein